MMRSWRRQSGRSSAGRVRASQARCRGFEPRRPLQRVRTGPDTSPGGTMSIFGREPEGKPPEPLAPVKPASAHPAEKDKGAAPVPVPVKPGTCTIAAKTVIKGEITGDEDVVVEGTVEGQIRI